MRLLIAYATTDGMTARIAQRLAEAARAGGHDVRVVDTAALPRTLDPRTFDAVLVGASLHAHGYQPSAHRFIQENLDVLRGRPSGFFSVCLAVISRDARARAEARRRAAAFPTTLGWTPDAVAVFAGALMFSRYGPLRRLVMRQVAHREMGGADESRDHVFTDWDAVDRFALAFLELAGAGHPPKRPPPRAGPRARG